MNYHYIPGFFGFEEFYDLLIDLAPPSFFMAEVGVFFGKSLIYMLERVQQKDKEVYITAIDNWASFDYEPELAAAAYGRNVEADFMRNILPYREFVEVCTVPSPRAAQVLQLHYDYTFLDARHDYESVKADIEAWLPWTDLIIAGHDYGTWPGVTQAVDELLPQRQILNNVWYVHKEKL